MSALVGALRGAAARSDGPGGGWRKVPGFKWKNSFIHICKFFSQSYYNIHTFLIVVQGGHAFSGRATVPPPCRSLRQHTRMPKSSLRHQVLASPAYNTPHYVIISLDDPNKITQFVITLSKKQKLLSLFPKKKHSFIIQRSLKSENEIKLYLKL